MNSIAYHSQMKWRVTIGICGINVYEGWPVDTSTSSWHAAAGGHAVAESVYRQQASHGIKATVDYGNMQWRATADVEDINSGRDTCIFVDSRWRALLPTMSVGHTSDGEKMINGADVAADARQM